MRNYTETDGTVIGNSDTTLEADTNHHHAKTLRERADYASLTRRAATDSSRALVNDVLRLITEADTRNRQLVSTTDPFKDAVEGLLGDLLAATAGRWIYRSTGNNSFAGGVVAARNFTAVRRGLQRQGLLKVIPGELGFGSRLATQFKATPQLEQLAAQRGILPNEAERHFVLPPPKHPLLLKGTSKWKGVDKIAGRAMQVIYTDKATALERTIIDLNDFLDGFDICGGMHRGYLREFNCGDHERFDWNLGGRLYSQGTHNYQRLNGVARRKMTINGKPVCEIDVRASNLTIFQSLGGEPLDFANNPDLDPYALPGLQRDVVKAFITATFGNGQFPRRWSQTVAEECKQYRISQVRDVVAKAYPLLAALRREGAQAPIWARLMYLESEAVLGAMLALQAEGIPSLSVHDSLIVPLDSKRMARQILHQQYRVTTGARPHIVTRDPALTTPSPNNSELNG